MNDKLEQVKRAISGQKKTSAKFVASYMGSSFAETEKWLSALEAEGVLGARDKFGIRKVVAQGAPK